MTRCCKVIIKYCFISILFLCGCTGRFISDDENKDLEKIIKLYDSLSWEDRNSAINQVCVIKSSNAVNLLARALDDTHSANRIQALECLGIRTEKSTKKRIKEIAESDPDSNVKLKAIQALAWYKDPSSAPVFAKGLSHEDWLIREESIKGMLMINDAIIREISIPYILKALDDPRINVRLTALRYLEVKNQRIYYKLTGIINDEKNFNKINLLKTCLNAINGYVIDPDTKKKLIKFLTHQNKDIRILALNVLKKENELLDSESPGFSLPESITGKKANENRN
jgi:HEAT repeat protein